MFGYMLLDFITGKVQSISKSKWPTAVRHSPCNISCYVIKVPFACSWNLFLLLSSWVFLSLWSANFSLKTTVFWVVAPCSLIEVYRRFRCACCLHYQGDRPDDGGSRNSCFSRKSNPCRPARSSYTDCDILAFYNKFNVIIRLFHQHCIVFCFTVIYFRRFSILMNYHQCMSCYTVWISINLLRFLSYVR
jgi:hypothetical protein